jgi:hypothetical protein
MHLVIRSVSKTAGISTLAKRNSNKKKDDIIAIYSFYRPRSDRIISNINQMKRFRSLYYLH